MAKVELEKEVPVEKVAAPVVATPALLTVTATDVVVDDWFVENFHNRGHSVEEYNRVREAVSALKARLNAVLR